MLWFIINQNSEYIFQITASFLTFIISQGSVVTYLRCGGMFKYMLQIYQWVCQWKNFWKSVNIWGSYEQEFIVLFFWLAV